MKKLLFKKIVTIVTVFTALTSFEKSFAQTTTAQEELVEQLLQVLDLNGKNSVQYGEFLLNMYILGEQWGDDLNEYTNNLAFILSNSAAQNTVLSGSINDEVILAFNFTEIVEEYIGSALVSPSASQIAFNLFTYDLAVMIEAVVKNGPDSSLNAPFLATAKASGASLARIIRNLSLDFPVLRSTIQEIIQDVYAIAQVYSTIQQYNISNSGVSNLDPTTIYPGIANARTQVRKKFAALGFLIGYKCLADAGLI